MEDALSSRHADNRICPKIPGKYPENTRTTSGFLAAEGLHSSAVALIAPLAMRYGQTG